MTIFTTNPETVLTNRIDEDFGFGRFKVGIGTLYTGEFKLCRAGGDSIGHGSAGGPTGTLGAVVEDAAQDEYALSCNHVIGDENRGALNVDEIWSPGSRDGGTSHDRVGLLSDFEFVHTGGVRTNWMDAATAKFDHNNARPFLIHGIGSVAGVNSNPAFNLPVKKAGFTTGLTNGYLSFKNMSLLVPFAGGQALFTDQYGVVSQIYGTQFADLGDSGSLVVSDANEAVGLLMAVAGTGKVVVVNPIEPILKRFGISF